MWGVNYVQSFRIGQFLRFLGFLFSPCKMLRDGVNIYSYEKSIFNFINFNFDLNFWIFTYEC